MHKAIRKRFWDVICDLEDATMQLRQDYKEWQQTLAVSYDQVKLFFSLTGSLPVADDHLNTTGRGPYFHEVRIVKRELTSSLDSDEMLVVYFLEAAEIEEFEEYQEGDKLDEDE